MQPRNKAWEESAIKQIADAISEEPVITPEAPPAPAKPKAPPAKPQPKQPSKPTKPQPWKKPFEVPKPNVMPEPMNKNEQK